MLLREPDLLVHKAIATMATGPAAKLFAEAWPELSAYADRHGYDVVIGGAFEAAGRPPAWGKVQILLRLLDTFDLVVWLDADTLIINRGVDIATVLPGDAWQGFSVVPCNGDEGDSPCMGVWALRRSDDARRFLQAVWEQEDLIRHPWWEQAAVMRLTGWTLDLPLRKTRDSEWDSGTYDLGPEWDRMTMYPDGWSPGYVRHYAGWPYPVRLFEMRTDLAGLERDRSAGIRKLRFALRFWLGHRGIAIHRWVDWPRSARRMRIRLGRLRRQLRP